MPDNHKGPIKLSREETLELENIQLRLAAAQSEIRGLVAQRGAVMTAISERYGVALGEGWLVDFKKGVLYKPTAVEPNRILRPTTAEAAKALHSKG